jgi:hypothetical protein
MEQMHAGHEVAEIAEHNRRHKTLRERERLTVNMTTNTPSRGSGLA